MSSILSKLSYDIRVCEALVELTAMIVKRYPAATFVVTQGGDPLGIYLRPIVDVDDSEGVLDLVMDRLLDLQIEHDLPLYVFPLWPQQRELSNPQPQSAANTAKVASG